jgi:WD repeat-containing protein 7
VSTNKQSKIHESRHKQVTAIVMMGVIGAEFGASLEDVSIEKTAAAEGFGLTNYAHARHTSTY